MIGHQIGIITLEPITSITQGWMIPTIVRRDRSTSFRKAPIMPE